MARGRRRGLYDVDVVHLRIVECDVVDPEIIEVPIEAEFLAIICPDVCLVQGGTGWVLHVCGFDAVELPVDEDLGTGNG
jgi:hypothetical protein